MRIRTRELVISLKTKQLTIDGIDVPCITTKVINGTSGKIQLTVDEKYLIDPEYKRINPRFQPLHVQLMAQCAMSNLDIDAIYHKLLNTDRIKRLRLQNFGFNKLQINLLYNLLLEYDACHEVKGALRKTEAFTQFLIGRKEAKEGELDERTLRTTTLDQLKEKERRAERIYTPLSVERLGEMSLLELQLEHSEAIEKGAKKVIIKRLENLMSQKKKSSHQKKSEIEYMKEIARDEAKISKENSKEKTKTKKSIIWKDKQGAEYIE